MLNKSHFRRYGRLLRATGVGIIAAAALVTLPVMAASADHSEFSKRGLVIGVANGYLNNWRAQMIGDIKDTAKPYLDSGVVKNVIIANANNNLGKQISQIHDMIAKGVDAIIVDAVSPTGIAPAVADAVKRGILVVGADNGPVSEKVINVQLDNAAWARMSAKWLFKQMGGKGNLLIVNGVAGQSVDTIRSDAVKSVLKDYPDINVLQVVYGNWNEAAAKQAVSRVLSTYSDIDGVWSQDGMGIGTIQAFQAADRELPIIATDDNVAYLHLWSELRKSGDFSTISVANPPGIGATAFKVTVRLLQGWKLKDSVLDPNPLEPSQHNTVLIKPQLVVTNDNLDDVLQAYSGKPGSYYLDNILSDEQVNELFAK